MMTDLTEFGENIFAAGDIHGLPVGLAEELHRCGIRNAAIIICGDVGLGFSGNHKGPIKYLNKVGADRGNHFYIFRGNHDNPSSWADELVSEHEKQFPYVHYLRDFDEVKFANNKLALTVPGAISIDRKWAVGKVIRDMETGEDEYKRFPRPEGKSYWADEHIRYDLIDSIDKKYDIVIAHTGPTPPSLRSNNDLEYIFRNYDAQLKDDLEEERKAVDKIIDKSGCDKWINGHFHIETKMVYAMNDAKFEYNGITVENVGIDEIIQITI